MLTAWRTRLAAWSCTALLHPSLATVVATVRSSAAAARAQTPATPFTLHYCSLGNVLCVGAADASDRRIRIAVPGLDPALGSNYGSSSVSIAAPGAVVGTSGWLWWGPHGAWVVRRSLEVQPYADIAAAAVSEGCIGVA